MVIFNQSMLEQYLKDDWILGMLNNLEQEEDKSVRTHKWIKEMDNKRMIYSYVYNDLLKKKNELRIIDVGGIYSVNEKAAG